MCSKPTSTYTTIHFILNHPMEHKRVSYSHLINRINTLPITDPNKQHKMNNVMTTAKTKGFPIRLIQKMRDKITHKRHRTEHNNMQTKEKIMDQLYI
jgi:hypothetical protein